MRIPRVWPLRLSILKPGVAEVRTTVDVESGVRVDALRRRISADNGIAFELWRFVSRARELPQDGNDNNNDSSAARSGASGGEVAVKDGATVDEAQLFLYRPRVRLASDLSDEEVARIVAEYTAVGVALVVRPPGSTLVPSNLLPLSFFPTFLSSYRSVFILSLSLPSSIYPILFFVVLPTSLASFLC